MPKRAPPLTDTKVKALKANGAAQRDVSDGKTRGLKIRVSKTGKKSWYFTYKRPGTSKYTSMVIGTYPATPLKKARAKARDLQTMVEEGTDPREQKREKQREREEYTFAAMAEEQLRELKKGTRESTWSERRRIYEKDLEPRWGDRPAAEISRRDVIRLVDEIEDRGIPITNRTLSLVKVLYNKALERGYPTVEANPAHKIPPRGKENGKERRRSRYLDREEIAKVWKATAPDVPGTGSALRISLLTAQRIGSVRAMRWQDVEEGVWVIPAEHFKGKRKMAVPLSPEALKELDRLREVKADDTWVFPSRAGAEEPHITNTSGTLQRVRKRAGIPTWTVHDFRRTFRTHAIPPENPEHESDPKGLGIAPHIADAVLGHKEASLGFDRYTGDPHLYLLPQKRAALRKWGRFVREVVEGVDG